MGNLPTTQTKRPHRYRRAALSVVVVGAVTTACSESAPDLGPRFDDETTNSSAGELTCMKHQQHPPGPRYTDDSVRRTDDTLALLRYYTANGAKPYCDGDGPTDTDRRWADLYVRLDADRGNVAPLLEGEG